MLLPFEPGLAYDWWWRESRGEARKGIMASALLAGSSPLEVLSCCVKGPSVPRHACCEEAQTSSSRETTLRALATLWTA